MYALPQEAIPLKSFTQKVLDRCEIAIRKAWFNEPKCATARWRSKSVTETQKRIISLISTMDYDVEEVVVKKLGEILEEKKNRETYDNVYSLLTSYKIDLTGESGNAKISILSHNGQKALSI